MAKPDSTLDPHAPEKPSSHWLVEVTRGGECVLKITDELVAGRDLSDDDQDLIRDCAQHLLAFVGPRLDAKLEPQNWRQEKRRLIEAVQRERDRAQAIIAYAAEHGCDGLASVMFLKNNEPDVIAIESESHRRGRSSS